MGKVKSTECRIYTSEYKLEAVRLVVNKGLSFREASEKLGIRESMLRRWKDKWSKEGDDAFPGNGKLPARDAEMTKLIEENRRLRMERDLLKKATAFFANPMN